MHDLSHIHLVVISGVSGSGKTVALHALEDAGYYCVDNLPPELLLPLVTLQSQHGNTRMAVAIDVRSAQSLHAMPETLKHIKSMGVRLSVVFLDTATDTLVRRFSETRRLHPLSVHVNPDQRRVLYEAIELERELLSSLRDQAMVIDTSLQTAAHLRSQIKGIVQHTPQTMTVVLESFAFKKGIPLDADFVFDVRMLPNPHYDPVLRPQTGLDAGVQTFLAAERDVNAMQAHIEGFLTHWLPALARDHRSYVTVAVGCTGGQHRSVYLVERLFTALSPQWALQKRHRELDVHGRH